MQFKYIIILAVIAFLVVLCVIYFNEIINFLKRKLLKNKKAKKAETKPKEQKNPVYSVEDFKPIAKTTEDETRDSSLNELFENQDLLFNNEFGDMFLDQELNNNNNSQASFQNNSDKRFSFDKEFESFNEMFGSKMRKKKNKSLSDKIKNLPPEIKALIIDNVLKRKDDI